MKTTLNTIRFHSVVCYFVQLLSQSGKKTTRNSRKSKGCDSTLVTCVKTREIEREKKRAEQMFITLSLEALETWAMNKSQISIIIKCSNCHLHS